jgi:hypothetical protein
MFVNDVKIEIAPLVVETFDQTDLPGSVPLFDLLLATDCLTHVTVNFEIDQSVDTVLLSEATDLVVAVFEGAANEIRCYTGVQRAVLTTGHDVDEGGHVTNREDKH